MKRVAILLFSFILLISSIMLADCKDKYYCKKTIYILDYCASDPNKDIITCSSKINSIVKLDIIHRLKDNEKLYNLVKNYCEYICMHPKEWFDKRNNFMKNLCDK